MALTSEGEVYAWGDNWDGQLGDGTKDSRGAPVRISNLSNVTAISAGSIHSVALTSDCIVFSTLLIACSTIWRRIVSTEAVPIKIETNMSYMMEEQYSVMLNSNGVMYVDGKKITTIDSIVDISVSYSTIYALKSDGSVYKGDYYKDIYDLYTTSVPVFVKIDDLSHITAISAGESHNLALTDNGTVYAWGANWYGQLGDGTTISSKPRIVSTIE